MQPTHDHGTILAEARVELRGPSGRLYGILDLRTLTIEVKRGGEAREYIDLRQWLGSRYADDAPPPSISPL